MTTNMNLKNNESNTGSIKIGKSADLTNDLLFLTNKIEVTFILKLTYFITQLIQTDTKKKWKKTKNAPSHMNYMNYANKKNVYMHNHTIQQFC